MKLTLPVGDVVIFDIEARPTAWIGGDYVGRSMTAYAYTTLDSDAVYGEALTRKDNDVSRLVKPLAEVLEGASLVVGHYIRGFDLPVINADLERVGEMSLGRILTTDTKSDRLQGLGISESLENLAVRYDLDMQKMSMHEPWWEEFNCYLTPTSRSRVLERCMSDVAATKELYLALLNADRLKAPKAWDPTNSKMPRYRS